MPPFCHYQNQIWTWSRDQIRARDQIWNREGTKIETLRISGHFKVPPRNITNINVLGEVIYHVANKRRMEKVPLSGSKLPPSGNNGLGRAGFRRKNFRYSNSPTFIDFEANCPLNCKSTIDCSIYTLWSGENYSPIRMARDLLQTLMLR